ncbi:protein translocase subunit SecD [Eubacterium oxidoreducens]|uniref:Multifunctional fusion protein n=1 Tax=Eubacterium oxidoreducens TaxID=1732 RepID=A0A1G6C1I1_EUBOX|nr:protein translocase subunit SecD [Eubacterium oxidoreducens]SDB26722.1 SecD/SecF fusion protein [Eubacterium oxidoreducens]
MKKSKSIVAIIIIVAIIAALGYYAFGVLSATKDKEDAGIKLGLDLAGGVSITYEAVDGAPSSEDMADTIYKLQRRAESYSTEASVYQQGDDRITIEIPGVSDANEVLEELGTPGSLEFQTPDGEAFLDGDDIADAQAASTGSDVNDSGYVVELTLTDEAAETFAEITGEYVGQQLPIVYDGETISSPTVQSQITGGTAQITGMDSYEEAEELASMIRIGSLSVELEEVQSEVVSAQLGSDAISTSLKAAAIGLAIVMILLIIFYAVPGVVAAIALALYTALVVSVINVFDVTLTLPGIAGIILSIGMAVDANVIIFARIREELAADHSVLVSIKSGFKKGLSAIVDGNITTLIAAAVLGARGSGSVRGFAATLAIGIVLSMFTALVISRILMLSFYGLGVKNERAYRKAKARKTINFIGKRRIYFLVSIVIIVIGFGYMGYQSNQGNGALNYSLEFVGGTSTTVEMDKDYTVEELESEVVPVVSEVTNDSAIQTQNVSDSNAIVIKTRTLDLEEREELSTALQENFGVAEEDIQYTNISSTISSEMRSDALWAVIIAAILMLIYIWFRFKDIRYASSAVLALVHDILIVLTCYALTRISVGSTFIACMLTLIGYSINDTIVIFDRFRENLTNAREKKDADAVMEIGNKSITQTITRSIMTSLTTFVMVFVLYLLGVATIKDFALPLIVGIISGTYSSIAIASGLWFSFKLHIGKEKLVRIPKAVKQPKEEQKTEKEETEPKKELVSQKRKKKKRR